MIIALFLIFIPCSAVGDPVVKLDDGVVRGTREVSSDGKPYFSFQGIPYARPPLGADRFEPPRPVQPWRGELSAKLLIYPCLQFDLLTKMMIGYEDCLYLNVFTPTLKTDAALPVLVFIHGGAFMFGYTSLYGPGHLMNKDIVLVSMSYRLGPLGFLSTDDDVVSGNAGLKDQSMALHWVKNNIHLFGGNPDQVTLSGHSAGAVSVYYHMMSHMSRGTFARAIAFSASPLGGYALSLRPGEKARQLASIVGCPTNSSAIMVKCLKRIPGETLVQAQTRMYVSRIHTFSHFIPVIERTSSENAFITASPLTYLLYGHIAQVPLMTSVLSEDGLFPAAAYLPDPYALPELEARWLELAADQFQYNDTLPGEYHAHVAYRIKDFYFGDEPINEKTFPILVKALTERHYHTTVSKVAKVYATRSSQPVYFFRYSFRGLFSLSAVVGLTLKNYGVCHGDEMLHLFKFLLDSTAPPDVKMRKAFVNMIYGFVATGVPKTPKDVNWLPVVPDSDDLQYLQISSGTDMTMVTKKDFGNQNFWESVFLI